MKPFPGTEPFEISFIHDGCRIQAHVELNHRQYEALYQFDRPGIAPQGFSLMALVPNQGGLTAGHLVDTIQEAIFQEGMDDENVEDDDRHTWKTLHDMAARIDEHASKAEKPSTYLVEFVWENGGGDDNLFGQSFDADDTNAEHIGRLERFVNALEKALDEGGHSYDFGYTKQTIGQVMDPNALDMQGLIEFAYDNDLDDLGDVLNKALEMKEDEAPRKSPRP